MPGDVENRPGQGLTLMPGFATNKISIILSLMLVLSHVGAELCHATERTLLHREKEMMIKSTGEIEAHYTFVFSTNMETHATMTIELPESRQGEFEVEDAWGNLNCPAQQSPARLHGNRLEFVTLCPAPELTYGFVVKLAADTFSGMFSDRFDVSESATGRYTLHLAKPAKLHVSVSPSLELLEQEKDSTGRYFSCRLSCKKPCSTGGSLIISTFASQLEMARRFKELWQDRCNNFSAELPDISAFAGGSEQERVAAIFGWFKGRFRYETSRRAGHLLVPETCGKIWASKAGDCKDLSNLLARILKSYNYPASPALVSKTGSVSGETPQTDFLRFDHAVVVTQLDTGLHVIDPATGVFENLDEDNKETLLILDETIGNSWSLPRKIKNGEET